jgi:hypothetical protein
MFLQSMVLLDSQRQLPLNMPKKELLAMQFAQDGFSLHSSRSKLILLLKEKKSALMKLMLSLYLKSNHQEKQALLKILDN